MRDPDGRRSSLARSAGSNPEHPFPQSRLPQARLLPQTHQWLALAFPLARDRCAALRVPSRA
uniref:Uncharacterized protein n=1 Tax=uncultured marine virus TaxID=186617 RepID=A0A0F7L289_9VIRU|nr:hypothetical protein [uncultured marine virus]